MVEMRDKLDEAGEAEPSHDNFRRPSSSIKISVIFGLVVVVGIFIGSGVWSALAPLAKAVPAFATLVVKGERKQIQHFEGGIIGSLHVAEGQVVKEGELLLALNPLQASASVARHDSQLDRALCRQARLESELIESKELIINGQLLDRLGQSQDILDMVEAEQRHLAARMESLYGTISILDQRIQQLNEEIKGLVVQRQSRLSQIKIFEEELVGLRELNKKGYYPTTKILAVERAVESLKGAAGNDFALIARAKSSRGEAKNQIINVKQRFREDAIDQLRSLQTEISDLNQRLLVAKDVLERIEIRAPRSGIVQGVKFHTVGGVVKPGEILMEIVPQDDDLVVNAQVQPVDIDSIEIGQRAEVRFTALNVRSTPTVYGYVMSISGDSLVNEQNNMPFFLARIELPDEERTKLGATKLTPGMPADVLIQTGERTALNYLLKPLTDAFVRGLNEE